MTWLIDTNMAIHLRDGQIAVVSRFAAFDQPPALSLISLVELQGGLAGDDAEAARRRERLAVILRNLEVIDFDRPVVDLYGQMVRMLGFSRKRILDRLIAATALVHDLTLVTINGADFRDIPNLKLEVWPAPDQ